MPEEKSVTDVSEVSTRGQPANAGAPASRLKLP
jgi:hypothetical protein